MKKLISLFVLSIFILSMGFVVGESEQKIYAHGNNAVEISDTPPLPDLSDVEPRSEGIEAKGRVKSGNYSLENGETMRVSVVAQNRTRLRINDTDVETELQIIDGENQSQIKLKAKLSNGRNAEIKVMPSVASERALERLRIKVCNESNNCSIELKEVGSGNQTRAAYEVQAQRHFRILGMFKTKAEVRAQVSAETGEILKVDKPWWAFLASEKEE